MRSKGYKLFRDPVHGYISVPVKYCEDFIDTPIFQRLRFIEQTSMRPLYPSAHHDRFAHSLGVFHLASLMFNYLQENMEGSVIQNLLKNYKDSFLIAGLMHDCGHAPFSHTFEGFYKKTNALSFLLEQVDKKFNMDYSKNYDNSNGPSQHEIFSAAIFLKHFRVILSNPSYLEADPTLIARMITGCVHHPAENENQEVENALIQMIHGRAIDVDKLDYIIRDTWASGVNNASIDINRLLSAIEIVKYGGMYVPSFRKSALSVVQSVVEGRNFLYNWIYSHHTVEYVNDLLKTALNAVSKKVTPDEPDKLIKTIFSKEVFDNPVDVNGVSIYLPSDGDIFYLFKKYKNDISEINEVISRKFYLIPLWKTHEEFNLIFEDKNDQQRSKICKNAGNYLSNVIGKSNSCRIKKIEVKPKIVMIDDNELFISFENYVLSYNKISIVKKEKSSEQSSFFYIFIPSECKEKIGECREKLKSIKIAVT